MSWYFENIEHCKNYQKEYRSRNKHIFRAKNESYRARKLNAEPKWLTKDMRKQMINIYKYCRLTSLYHEVFHSVDHIIPLKGDNICGLHVPWNLQIITSKENMKKKNKTEYEYHSNYFIVIDDTIVKNKPINFERKVIRLNDGKVFNSVTLAAKDIKCNPSTITQVCKGDRTSIKRKFYKYYDEVDSIENDFNNAVKEYLKNPKTRKAVYCKEINQRFDTVKDVADFFKIKDYKVREICNKNTKYKGLSFEYCI